MTTLDELLTRVAELRNKVALGEINLINQDLGPYFAELSSLISPDKLEVGLAILKDSTAVLEEKFEAIQQYIQELLNKDRVIQYLNSHPPDSELAGILESVMVTPELLPQCSVTFLEEAFSKLVSNKPVFTRSQPLNSEFIVSEKDVEHLSNPEDPFERRMMDYYTDILPQLPATIDNILNTSSTKDQFFEHFSYILHLMQNGILRYEKPSKEVKADDSETMTAEKKKNE